MSWTDAAWMGIGVVAMFILAALMFWASSRVARRLTARGLQIAVQTAAMTLGTLAAAAGA